MKYGELTGELISSLQFTAAEMPSKICPFLNNSDMSSITHAFIGAVCKVYKVKFQLLDSVYDLTNQCDIVQDIAFRRERYEHKLLSSSNLVIRNFLAVSLVY